MKKYFVFVALIVGFLSIKAQEENITFKDGKSVPGRKAFMENCVAGMKAESKKGKASNSQNNYCNCVLSAITSVFTLDEFLAKVDQLDKIMEDENEPIYKEIVDCSSKNIDAFSSKKKSDKKGISSTAEVDKKDKSMYDDNAFEKGFMTSCKDAIVNTAGLGKEQIDAEKYCRCTFDKMKERNLSLSKIGELQDRNSPLFNEIVTPCLQDAMKPAAMQNTVYSPSDILGDIPKSEIKLSKLMNVYRLSVKFGTIEKYFVLDSGANDVFIDEALERALLMDGLIKKADYLSDQKYMMADGNQITCRRLKLSGFKIGEYTVNNVTVAITDQKSGLLLLGKSLLDKFKHWSIDNEKAILFLEK